jgi:hypothetical protein
MIREKQITIIKISIKVNIELLKQILRDEIEKKRFK